MRPTHIQQNPISFIRKWPKAKRDLRGPSERIEVVTVSMTAGEIRDFKVPETLGAMLAAEVNHRCPKGWAYNRMSKPELIQERESAYGRITIRYFRPTST